MDADVDVSVSEYTTRLGPAKIWTWDLGYGQLYDGSSMPDRRTRKRLREYIARKRAIQMFKEVEGMLT